MRFLALLTALLITPLTLAMVAPDAIWSRDLDPRQTLTAPGNYSAGGFTVAASDSPCFTANSVSYYLQTDGNFVAYSQPSGSARTVVFSTNTAGHSCAAGNTGKWTSRRESFTHSLAKLLLILSPRTRLLPADLPKRRQPGAVYRLDGRVGHEHHFRHRHAGRAAAVLGRVSAGEYLAVC